MEKKHLFNEEEFNDFISKITIEDVILIESSSKLFSIKGKKETSLQTKINLSAIDMEIVSNPENQNDFIILVSLGANFSIFKETEELLNIFAKVQAVYKVLDLKLKNTQDIMSISEPFIEESAYIHILAFLRNYIMEMVSKAGYPRYILPLFKQPKENKYKEN